jgi:hypothetical protein
VLVASRRFSVTLDTTPPQSTLGVGTPGFPAVSPGFVTGATPLTISAVDAGAGVASVTATMDGAATVGGHGLASGQASPELGAGSHTFVVTVADNVGNTSSVPVQFTVGS